MHLHCRRNHLHATLAPQLLLSLLLLFAATTAKGQTSGDLTFATAYTTRGVALSTRPVLQLRVEHDTDAGWYAGGFATPVTLEDRTQGQLVAYGGRAQRLSSTLSWDAGVTRTAFLRDGYRSYTEFYAGLALGRLSARLFYSPSYYGEARTAYLDLNGAWPLGDRLRLAAHAGLLHPFGDYLGTTRDRGDARLALVTDVGDYSVEVGLQTQWRAYVPGARRAPALTASASLHF
jgi:uncharacterized protein (TIGR02001 family)